VKSIYYLRPMQSLLKRVLMQLRSMVAAATAASEATAVQSPFLDWRSPVSELIQNQGLILRYV